jgi:hypothetical protein
MQAFGISSWKVNIARIHAGTQGAARPVPPAVIAFRITPEAAEWLNDFVNRPEYTQTLASNQGGDQWVAELTLRPEQLARKYADAVPPSLRVERSKVLEYLNQKCFRLQRAKSCLCGPCEEFGWQNFADLKDLIGELGLGSKETAGFLARVDALSDYLRHEYRRECTNLLTAGCQGGAAYCIPYALSGDQEFACSCRHQGEHNMDREAFNERFYLIADVRSCVDQVRVGLQVSLDAITPAAQADDGADAEGANVPAISPEAERIADNIAELDERTEDLDRYDRHLDLYIRHLLRKALSSTITLEFLEQLKVAPNRVHLIIDYKQKVLPERARATQTEAFGKRGKSLHGGTALRWDSQKEDFRWRCALPPCVF